MDSNKENSLPSQADRAYKRALAHHQNGRLQEAVAEYALTVRLSPYSPNAYNNFGVALRALGRPHGAIACYRRSIAIRPGSANVLTNLGNAFRDLGLIKQSIAAHARAIKIDPNSANAHFNGALAYRDNGQVTLSLEHFQKSLAIDPANMEAKLEMGISLLMAGEWEEGFQLLDTRMKLPNYKTKRDIPHWRGTSLSGKTILITHEGNPGTQIMIVRFARSLKLAGAKIIMEAPERVISLLRLSPDIDEVISIGSDVKNADFQIPLLSVPGKLKTTINNVPNETPYLRPSLKSGSHIDIGPDVKLGIGIVWAGDDVTPSRKKAGLCKLEDLMEIVAIPGTLTFSLTAGEAAKEIEEIGVQELVINAVSGNTDLAEIAAIIEQLDLIITVDSAVAHIAGAMGKPTWLLAAPGGDWCWLLDGEKTPWYPSIKIFRKRPDAGWPELISKVRKNIQDILKGDG